MAERTESALDRFGGRLLAGAIGDAPARWWSSGQWRDTRPSRCRWPTQLDLSAGLEPELVAASRWPRSVVSPPFDDDRREFGASLRLKVGNPAGVILRDDPQRHSSRLGVWPLCLIRMALCPGCGTEHPERVKFCLECGTTLAGTAPSPVSQE